MEMDIENTSRRSLIMSKGETFKILTFKCNGIMITEKGKIHLIICYFHTRNTLIV